LMFVLPFRVFGPAARDRRVATTIRPLGVGCSFRVMARSGIAVIGLAIPLCRWPSLGFVVFPEQTPPATVKQPVESTRRVSPP